VQVELSPQGLGVSGEACQVFGFRGRFAEFLAQDELGIGQVEHGLGTGRQRRVLPQVVLDEDALAAPPAPQLVGTYQGCQAGLADVVGCRREGGGWTVRGAVGG
jgi:hypothetical protein